MSGLYNTIVFPCISPTHRNMHDKNLRIQAWQNLYIYTRNMHACSGSHHKDVVIMPTCSRTRYTETRIRFSQKFFKIIKQKVKILQKFF